MVCKAIIIATTTFKKDVYVFPFLRHSLNYLEKEMTCKT